MSEEEINRALMAYAFSLRRNYSEGLKDVADAIESEGNVKAYRAGVPIHGNDKYKLVVSIEENDI